MRISPMFFDFLRRPLRLAGVVAGIPLLLLADAAGAAEVRTYYVACGGSENVAQLVPIDAVRTKALDTRKSPPTFAAAFSFPANTDNIATHLGEVAQMLRIAGIPGCESSMRIAGYGGDIIYPRPANLSPYLDTAEARRQQHWTHAEVRYLQERGQGDVITTTDARSPIRAGRSTPSAWCCFSPLAMAEIRIRRSSTRGPMRSSATTA